MASQNAFFKDNTTATGGVFDWQELLLAQAQADQTDRLLLTKKDGTVEYIENGEFYRAVSIARIPQGSSIDLTDATKLTIITPSLNLTLLDGRYDILVNDIEAKYTALTNSTFVFDLLSVEVGDIIEIQRKSI